MSRSSCCSVENSVGKLNVNIDVDVWIVESKGLTGVAVVASAQPNKRIQSSEGQTGLAAETVKTSLEMMLHTN
jgi:hypothetical protein